MEVEPIIINSEPDSAIEELAKWVEKKPIIIKTFNEEDSTRFIYAKSGRLDFITFTRPHSEVYHLKFPTACLFELTIDTKIHCFIGTIKGKAAVSTLDSRLTVTKLMEISISSFDLIFKNILDTGHRNRFKEHLHNRANIEPLTPRLSSYLIKILASDPSNHNALKTIVSQLPGLQHKTDIEISSENALKTALGAFGLDMRAFPKELYIKPYSSSVLNQLNSVYILEDNVINKDASQIDGFVLKNKDITGKAVFFKKEECLEVYTANRNPLEKAFGVDLIYYNQTLGNILMVQYKMLENNSSDENINWNFRLDHQTKKEISRMKIPKILSKSNDYRLNGSPFYFKFIERKSDNLSIKSFVISLDHLNQILKSPQTKGPRGGININYEALNGSYLRESDFMSLIRSGYIGTHKVESDALIKIISEISKGNKELIFAWQKKIESEKI